MGAIAAVPQGPLNQSISSRCYWNGRSYKHDFAVILLPAVLSRNTQTDSLIACVSGPPLKIPIGR